MVFMLIAPLFSFSVGQADANPGLTPFTPHETKVLVVSPGDVFYNGANYLTADLARYGFNITLDASNDNPIATNYLTDPKTSDLSQYDVVIVHGILGFPTSMVSAAEVAHFTNYHGILILIGNALFQNESSGDWWGFSSEPVREIGERSGVDFTGFLGTGGAWHNNGTFTLMDSSIKGLPSSLSYVTEHPGSINFQMDLDFAADETRELYEFDITSSPSPSLVDRWTLGVTYYEGVSGTGICIQGAYVYGIESGTEISYFGLTDIQKRSSLLGSLIAYALKTDVNTLIKPQPLATIRLDGVGQYFLQTYLNACLFNFNSIIDNCNITPTVSFIDFLDNSPYDYWKSVAPEVLSKLNGEYRDWEYSSALRNKNTTSWTQSQTQTLINEIKGNYSSLGFDQFSAIATNVGYWDNEMLTTLLNENMNIIDSSGDAVDLANYSSEWWSLRVDSKVIVHSGLRMAPDYAGATLAENFTQSGLDKNALNYRYFSNRDSLALAVVNGFPTFIFYVPNFRWNEVGTYSLRTVFRNLTSEIPDIRFVPLMEAGLYFGNKWMRIENASRSGSIIEFDIDASRIPSVGNIDKGMLWLRINANESIQGVSIDNNSWFYFDTHSIRMPAPTGSSHIKITLGASPSPRIAGSRYKVVEARYDGYRFNVSISSAPTLNVSVNLFLPQVGSFRNTSWSVYSMEDAGNYYFDPQSRMLTFWAISDGYVTFEAGLFWTTEQTRPWYNSSVTITVNVIALGIGERNVTLSYDVSDRWVNLTMTQTDGLWAAAIPAMPYGTVVKYKVFVQDAVGHWLVSGELSYNVIDDAPPEVGDPTWNPLDPAVNQSVSVSVSVTKPINSSGLREVILWYFLGTEITGLAQATSINMTRENDNMWIAVIPGQRDGATVSFFISAYDKAGNVEQTAFYSYEVGESPVFPFSSFQIMLIGISIVSGIGIVLYYVKSRKNKRKTVKVQQQCA